MERNATITEEELEKEKGLRTGLQKAFHCVFFHKTTFNKMYHANPIGGKKQKSKWTVDCHYTAKNIIKKIQEARQRVKGRLIMSCKDIIDFVKDVPREHVMYLDPPYWTVGD
ncbi:MAG: DNA adenine methylase, partial [Candidatus Kariarchaeaceae archaeon]